jgi:hypothetical protein
MEVTRTVGNLLEGKTGRGRREGRPRVRWVAGIELNLMNMGVKRWRKRALDRTE